MASVRDFYKRKLLAAKDLKPNQAIIGVISAAYPEESKGDHGVVTKLVIELNDGSYRIQLNKGNAESLGDALGDDYDTWIGRKVKVTAINTKFKDQPCKGLLVEKSGK